MIKDLSIKGLLLKRITHYKNSRPSVYLNYNVNNNNNNYKHSATKNKKNIDVQYINKKLHKLTVNFMRF